MDGIKRHIPRNQNIPGYGLAILYIPVALQHPRFLGTVFITRNGNRPSIIRRIHIFWMFPHQFQMKPYHIKAERTFQILLHFLPVQQTFRQFPQAYYARILFHVTHRPSLLFCCLLFSAKHSFLHLLDPFPIGLGITGIRTPGFAHIRPPAVRQILLHRLYRRMKFICNLLRCHSFLKKRLDLQACLTEPKAFCQKNTPDLHF